MADIRDPNKFVAGRWAYDKHGYSTAFGGSITPGDIDSVVERNRHFLFLEHKEYVETRAPFHMPTGQAITLRRLAELPKVTVLYVCGKAETGDPFYIRQIKATADTDIIIDLRLVSSAALRKQALFKALADWWSEANTSR